MRTLFSILSCLLFIPVLATQVSGTQSGTWSVTNNPYILIGDVTVPVAQTLSIEPGVIVQSQGNFQMIIQGLLMATGTQTDSIHFGITSDNTGGAWKGIRFENVTGMSELHFCDIRKAENGANIIAAPVRITNCHFSGNTKGINCFGLATTPSSVIITDCFIEYSKENGVYIVENSDVHISECDISNNGVASTYRASIQLSIQTPGGHCSPFIENNHIHHNRWQGITGWDVTAQGTMEPQITNNNIEYNYTGIYLLNSDGQVQHNDITHNFIPGNMNSGAGVMVGGASSTPMFHHNTITGNYTGFYLANNANPCIGDLSEDVITYWGYNTISDNIDANGILHSIYLYQYTNPSIVVKAENNSWGTTDTLAIAISIQDHADDPALGTVDFMPISNGEPVQSISGTITPLEGMLGCQIIAVDVFNPQNTISTFMNVDHTYQIPLENPGVFYVTAYGHMFEDITPSMCGAYDDVYNPMPVEVWLTEHVQNINIVMQPFPAYMFARIGNSFQQDNLTLYPYEQGLFVTPMPIVMNLYFDDPGNNIKIHSFTNNSVNPPNIITLNNNNILVPEDDINQGDSWNSSRMIYNEDIWEWQLVNVTSTAIGAEILMYNEQIHWCWLIETRDQATNLVSKEWYAYSLGVMRAKMYNGPFLVHKKNLQYVSLTADNSYLPLETGSKWFYQYEIPLGPSELVCMPGNATNFFFWDPTTAGETPWTHYKFYEDNELLAQLPITQTQFGVLQDFYHTHNYFVTAWREGYESFPSNIITIEGVPNPDDTDTPVAPKLSVYPNPCNLSLSSLNIKVELLRAEQSTITIYNVRGQRVRQLKTELKASQSVIWDGKNEYQKQVNDGVYIVKMESKGKAISNKVVVIK